MNEIDIPILKKTYELYKIFHAYRKQVPKHDRFTIYERSEQAILEVIECFFTAGYNQGAPRATSLAKASLKLNMLRLFIRLMKDTQTLDTKKYTTLQEIIDDIGRQLGGWSRSIGR